MWDYLIKNGYIVDGTGAPWFKGDLAVEGEKIVDIGRNLSKSNAEQVIDSKGFVVSPGFIDMHSHSELTFLAYPRGESMIHQGVTTEFTCQCGTSATGPLKGESLKDTQEAARKHNLDVTWKDLAEYIKRFEKQGCSLNGAFQVGHATVRLCVIGWENRAPTTDELEDMKTLVAQSMEQGAYGLSTGTMYPPGNFAETSEIIELAKVVARYNGLHTSHIRRLGFENEARGGRDFIVRIIDSQYWAIRECIKIGEEAGIPTTWSHAKALGRINRGESLKNWIKEVEYNRRNGVDVGIDVYPWTYRGALVRGIPTWAHEGGRDKLIERLKDPELHKIIRESLDKNMTSITAEHTWEDALILSASNEDKDLIGKTIAEAAKIKTMLPVDLYLDRLIRGTPLEGHAQAVQEDDLITLLKHPLSMICTDGHALPSNYTRSVHPRSFGTFPKILRKYVREERVLTLEEAIRKMTSAGAARLGLFDRGLLRPGCYADITIFDPINVREKATYLEPIQLCKGIKQVFVNGMLTIENDEHTGALAGKALTRK